MTFPGDVKEVDCKETMEEMLEGLATRSGSSNHLKKVIMNLNSKEDDDLDQETDKVLEHIFFWIKSSGC